MRRSASVAIDEWHSDPGKSRPEDSNTYNFLTVKRHNIFHTCLQSSLPPPEKTPDRLGQEGFVAIAAGGETCARMLSNALYYILTNEDRVMPHLKRELSEVMPTPKIRPEWKELERLPYLVRAPPPVPTFSIFFLLVGQASKRYYVDCDYLQTTDGSHS